MKNKANDKMNAKEESIISVKKHFATAFAVSILFLALSSTASAGALYVPEDYPTIQDAIDNVTDEDRTIVVDTEAYTATETIVASSLQSDILITIGSLTFAVTDGMQIESTPFKDGNKIKVKDTGKPVFGTHDPETFKKSSKDKISAKKGPKIYKKPIKGTITVNKGPKIYKKPNKETNSAGGNSDNTNGNGNDKGNNAGGVDKPDKPDKGNNAGGVDKSNKPDKGNNAGGNSGNSGGSRSGKGKYGKAIRGISSNAGGNGNGNAGGNGNGNAGGNGNGNAGGSGKGNNK